MIRMAREAGFFIKHNEIYSMSTQSDQELTEWIERFSALVASAEREACAKVADDFGSQTFSDWPGRISDAFRARE